MDMKTDNITVTSLSICQHREIRWRGNPEVAQLIARLWCEGKSSSKIIPLVHEVYPGVHLTKGVIMGIVWRNQLPRHGKPKQFRSKNKYYPSIPKAVPVPEITPEITTEIDTIPADKCSPSTRPMLNPEPTPGKGIMDLERYDCRWIIDGPGETRYCGERFNEGNHFSYCETHMYRVLRCYAGEDRKYVR